MKRKRILILAAMVAFGMTSAPAYCQLIDFETLPDGSIPRDGMVISNQFLAKYGISFVFTDGTFPRIAKSGPPRSAFYSPYGDDTLAPGQNCGDFFLTDDGVVGYPPPPLIINYATNVSAASGVILDIDAQEAWKIQARNGTNILATVSLLTNSPNAGNALAAPWSFQRASADITSIVITYSGQIEGRVGLAFDNFSPGLATAPSKLMISASPQSTKITIGGSFGKTYRVDYAPTATFTNWHTLTNLTLTNLPQQSVVDTTVSNAPARFYRAVGIN